MIKNIITNLQELKEELKLFKPVYSLDTETTDLRLSKLKMAGFSLCDGERGFYVPLTNVTNPEDFTKILHKFVMNCTKGIIMHNAKFDLEVLHLSGIPYDGPVFCTQTAAHLLDENRPNGLKDLAISELDIRNVQTYKEASAGGMDSDDFYTYAVNDAIWTYKLYKMFKPQLQDQGLYSLFTKIEMPFQHVLAEMELAGVKVDSAKLAELEKEVREKLNSIVIEMCNMAEVQFTVQELMDGSQEVKPSVNFNSSKQVIDIIENKFGIEITEVTKKGNKSLGKESLLQLKDRHPFIGLLNQYKIGKKCYNAFISPLPDLIDPDGRVRSSFNNCIAKTGRLSSSNPNLQQLPNKKDEFPIEFRKVFIADEGKSLAVLDYSGQEITVLAHITQDPTLMDALWNNKDQHLMTANKMYGLGLRSDQMKKDHPDYEELKTKYKKERHAGKNGINFPIIYGTTAYGISRNLGVTEEQAESYIKAFFDLYPEVKRSLKKCTNQLWKKNFVRTLVGRYRHLDPRFKKSHRQAFNFWIQGLSADMIRWSMVKIREHLKLHPEYEAKQVMSVHDEIVLEVKDESADKLFREAKHIMETIMKFSVPLVVEGSVAKNYGAAK